MTDMRNKMCSPLGRIPKWVNYCIACFNNGHNLKKKKVIITLVKKDNLSWLFFDKDTCTSTTLNRDEKKSELSLSSNFCYYLPKIQSV